MHGFNDITTHVLLYLVRSQEDTCIQTLHLGKYIVGQTVDNLVL